MGKNHAAFVCLGIFNKMRAPLGVMHLFLALTKLLGLRSPTQQQGAGALPCGSTSCGHDRRGIPDACARRKRLSCNFWAKGLMA